MLIAISTQFKTIKTKYEFTRLSVKNASNFSQQ